MPVLAKSCGIVLQTLIDRTLGKRLHAFHGDAELVIALHPIKVIQSDVPPWVEEWVLDWVKHHYRELVPEWHFDADLAIPLSRQAAWHLPE
jgi:hypothetical protein